jgi:STE24 endopeptidase
MVKRTLVVLGLLVASGLGMGRVVAAQAQAPAASAPAAAPSLAPESQARDPYSVTVTDEMRSHQHWADVLYFAGTGYGFLLLIGVLALGISRRLAELAARVSQRRFLAALVYFALLSVVLTLLSFPFDYLSDFVVPHHFKLSAQGFPSWLWDQVKGLLLGILVGAPIAALALVGIRRIRRWWLALWIGAIPIVVFLLLIAPVLLDPVFNKFEPLQDATLKSAILEEAAQAGITGGRVYQVDRSKQTNTMNAYVNGLGPTKRIVLWDTLIAKMDREEVSFVMAHEMGHYVLHHVFKFLGFLLLVLFLVFWLGQTVVEAAVRRWGGAWGFAVPHDLAALPLLMLTVSVFMFLMSPVLNGGSRYFEHQADVFGLELTHQNLAGMRAFVKFAEDSKVLPDPHPFIRFWRYSHPTLAERIVFCRSYRPWETGEPNRAWKPAGR